MYIYSTLISEEFTKADFKKPFMGDHIRSASAIWFLQYSLSMVWDFGAARNAF